MEQIHGLPATDLSDADLERQIDRTHATRNWVFLHGTTAQYSRHTERMLELEQEYLRRHPQRTWQGVANAETPASAEDRIEQIREVLEMFKSEMDRLIGELTELAALSRGGADETLNSAEAELLRRFARSPRGRMHKLEAHQAARQLGIYPVNLAQLYRHDPPFLAAEGAERVLTEAGRHALAQASPSR